jgi:hypothetical protein
MISAHRSIQYFNPRYFSFLTLELLYFCTHHDVCRDKNTKPSSYILYTHHDEANIKRKPVFFTHTHTTHTDSRRRGGGFIFI